MPKRVGRITAVNCVVCNQVAHNTGDSVLSTSMEPLHMLLSEFASTDLTTAMIKGGAPSFGPDIWRLVEKRSVWWSQDPLGRLSLASVFADMSRMVSYLTMINCAQQEPDITRVREFEALFDPRFVPLAVEDLDSSVDCKAEDALETVNAHALIRAFQYIALIYLHSAVYRLPVSHVLVQQHVLPCLNYILDIEQPSTVLNCVIFPLLVVGAHAISPRHRLKVLNIVNAIYSKMKFNSV